MMSPLMSNGVAIGSINVTRAEPGAFAPHHVQLLQTFADQAVIAIENARLFNETKEALARQTATSDVLKVIASSPSKLQPVFDAIAERSKALIGAHSTVVVRYVEGMIELAAFTPVSPEADAAIRAMFGVPRPPTTGDPQTEQVLRGEIARIFDAESELQSNAMLGAARARGWRSRLLVPLKDDTGVIGWIGITRREPGGFAEKDVELLQTFADQAVIAINNVRLFEEVQERTRDLTDSLQQQTATADVLKVISASPGELEPVFQAMLENAVRLCEAKFAMLFLYQAEENTYRAVGKWNLPTAWAEFLGKNPLPADPRVPLGRVATTKQPVQVPDVLQDQAYIDRFPGLVAVAELGGARTLLQVPLLKENELVGAFGIYRQEVRPFTDKQVELVRNFAAQAVIAIENARLLNELRQRTSDLAESLQQQTATADVLQIISSSPGDLAPVFEKMLENATRVCGAEFGSMNLVEDDLVRQAALYNAPPAFAAARANAVRKPHPRGTLAEAIETKQVIHVADVRTTASYLEGSLASVELAELGGARTVAVVPMLRDNEVIGAITVYRQEIRLFDDKQIDLLSNFARQAVIAIENARLLRELRQRTDDLSKSLDDLRTAQDRLVQTEKLASLGQLTAGIAHEIKNPLNFVNNFSALSTELADELNAVLMQERLTDKGRQEVDELTGLLKDNLGKVVQHGKRADSIVKNMLLHSREGSGEQRAADINALVDESLNLAYHGARAEKSGFNITLQRDFDGSAGSAELFPQEITRALLNLISNGFYAATKRSNDGEAGFEPTLLAATKSLGNSVEIRIRDNGAGIPSEIKEKIFNPFFTTKPAGEGTGLGLSMSHDIIVKQHGGTIRVNTKLGAFTEFIITLPRAISVQSSQRSTN